MEILNLEQHEIPSLDKRLLFLSETIGGVFQNNAEIVLLVIPFLWKECERCKYAVLSSLHGKNRWDAKTITCKVNVNNFVRILQK